MVPRVALQGVARTHVRGDEVVHALHPLDLVVDAGELVAIVGRSGSGKSTLLNLVSGIDRPSAGTVRVDGTDLGQLDESRLARFRGARIGIVFQFFELLPTLTALENVVIAMDLVGVVPARARRARAESLLARMGLGTHGGRLPSRLSGGEQQRVAIARALANDPPILVADEPCGNLDSGNADAVMALFADCAAEGRTVLIATHERGGLERYDRVIRLVDGRQIVPSEEAA